MFKRIMSLLLVVAVVFTLFNFTPRNAKVYAAESTPYEVAVGEKITLKSTLGLDNTHSWTSSDTTIAKVTMDATNNKIAVVENVNKKSGTVTITHSYKTSTKWNAPTLTETFSVHYSDPVDKTVHWVEEGKSAEIVIQSIQTKEANAPAPKVLFLGSLCTSHSLTTDLLAEAINNLAAVADVDYYMYGLKMGDLSASNYPVEGKLKKGGSISASSIKGTASQMHICLFYFAEVLGGLDLTQYDLIVLEFDGVRMANMGSYKYNTGLTQKEIVDDLNAHYKVSTKTPYANPQKNPQSGYSKHYGKTITWADIEADLAEAAYKLVPEYKAGKVAWLLPTPIAQPGTNQYTVGAKLIYDDYAFLGRKYNALEKDADANLKREAWDALAIMAPETWLAKDTSGNYLKQKGNQPTTETDINAALFTEGTTYYTRGTDKFKDGKGLWTTYDQSETISELLDAKTYDLIHYQDVNITDMVAKGFKVTGVRGEYLDETAYPPVWKVVTDPDIFSYTLVGSKVSADFDLKALKSEKTRLVIEIETTEEIQYKTENSKSVVQTNQGPVVVVYDGDEDNPVKDDPPVLEEPGVDIKKIPNPGNGETAFVGDKISYIFKVKNIGSINITNAKVTDSKLSFTYTYTKTIAPNSTLVIVGLNDEYTPVSGETVVKADIPTHSVTSADLTNGTVKNEANVEATLSNGTKIYDESDVSNPVKEKAFQITKTSDYEGKSSGAPAEIGTEITYTVTVKNISSRTISNIVVTDNLTGAVAQTSTDYSIDTDNKAKVIIPSLEAGSTMDVTYKYKVTAADSEAYSIDGTLLTNTATVSAEDEYPETGSCSDTPDIIKVSVQVSKVWDDNGDQDGKRPSSIELQLKKKVGDAQEVNVLNRKKSISSNDSWKTTFENLPKYENGIEIVYSVAETTTDVITNVDGAGTYKIDYSTTSKNNLVVTNKHTPEKVSINVSKVWDDNNNQDGKRPNSVEVQLYTIEADKSLKKVEGKTVTLSNDNSWKATFSGLDKYNNKTLINYTVDEVDTTVITGVDGAETYSSKVEGNMADGFVITNKHTPTKTSVSVEKVWDDDNNRDGLRLDYVEVQLYKKIGTAQEKAVDGKKIKLDSANSWKGTFTDLPEYEGGKLINYTVQELTDTVVTGVDGPGTYAINISGDMTDGYKITNKHTPELVSVTVTKKWTDGNNQDGIRPDDVEVALTIKNDIDSVSVLEPKVELNSLNSWTHTFENLYKYMNGKLANYGVVETIKGVVTGYDKAGEYAISYSTTKPYEYEIENIHTPETLDTTITIDWDDNNDQDGKRPDEVEVTLYKKVGDGQETPVDGMTFVIKGEDWEQELKDLPKFEGGEEIKYSVKETTTTVLTGEDGPGTYSIDVTGGSSNGFTIVNLHTPEKVSYNVKKVWADNSDQDGIRPESVKVKLYKKVGSANETFVEGKELELKETNSWAGAFTDLDKYEGGVEIKYNVYETTTAVITDTDGEKTYKLKVEYKADEGFIVTNTHTPSVFDFTVKAEWDDADNQDGIRPDEVVVQLYKKVGDGEEAEVKDAKITLKKDDGYTDSFENLPKYEDGQAVTYTVKEVTTSVITGIDKAGEYKIEVKESSTTGTTFKNVHTPEKVSVAVEKVWVDADNQDGIRPEKVEILLIMSVDGSTPKAVDGKKLELSDTNSWKGTFSDLDKYEDGIEIDYMIDEVKTAVITDEDTDDTYAAEISEIEGGFKVTNTHTPAKISVFVEKEWNDADDQDGIRPESVEIVLNKTVGIGSNPSEVTKIKLDDGNSWKHTFEDLDKFENGNLIKYTVDETLTSVITGEDTDDTYIFNVTGSQADGYKVTNKHTPATVSIEGHKTWDDAEYIGKDGYTRPSEITLHFFGTIGGDPFKAYDDVVLTADDKDAQNENQWNFKIVNLPKFKDGVQIEYSVTETSVEGFKDASIVEFVVTNTPKDKTEDVTETSITIKKEDSLTETGIGLEGAKFKLEKNIGGEWLVANSLFVTDENGELKITFTTEGTYRLTETEAPNGYTLPEEAPYFDIVVEKELINVEFDKENDVWVWNYKLVADKTINDYLDDDNAVVLKNEPTMISVSVKKVWADDENQDGARAEAVKVQLLRSIAGDEFEAVKDAIVTLDETNEWTAEFKDLVKAIDGDEVVYKVEEVLEGSVTGEDGEGTYAVKVEGDENTGFIITNTHTSETMDIDVNVIWDDEHNKYNDRPEEVKVTLYEIVDGKPVKVTDVVITGGSTDDTWTKVIENLPVYRDGKKIQYVLDDEDLETIDDYTSSLEDFTITNVHSIPKPTGDTSMALWFVILAAAAVVFLAAKSDKKIRINK